VDIYNEEKGYEKKIFLGINTILQILMLYRRYHKIIMLENQ
jgi:hypothetical protein